MYKFLYYFLNENFDWDCSFHNFLYWHYLFSDYLNFSDFDNWNMNYLLHNCWSFYFNNFFFDNLLSHKFWNFYNSIYNLLDNSWNFNNFFNLFFNCYNFIVMNIDIPDNLYWNMDNLFNFNNLWSLNYLLHNLFDWDNLRNLDNSVNYFLNYFFNFDNLGYNSEDFQDIININYVHNLSIDHTDYTFIDVENGSCFSFQFL